MCCATKGWFIRGKERGHLSTLPARPGHQAGRRRSIDTSPMSSESGSEVAPWCRVSRCRARSIWCVNSVRHGRPYGGLLRCYGRRDGRTAFRIVAVSSPLWSSGPYRSDAADMGMRRLKGLQAIQRMRRTGVEGYGSAAMGCQAPRQVSVCPPSVLLFSVCLTFPAGRYRRFGLM